MHKTRVGIIHNEPAPACQEFSEASHDVLVQVEAIERVLRESGYPTVRILFTRDLNGFTQRMREAQVHAAFNLCETVDEDPRLAGHPAAVLELMEIPFTGSPSMALMLTTDKLMTKRLLRARGIRTPDYLVYEYFGSFNPAILNFPVIAKPRYQDASVGIDQESVFKNKKELLNNIERLYAHHGTLIIEEFLEGREFNISLIGHPRARVLPLAEIDFGQFPADLHPIVGYKAKWDRSSFEYNHTPQIFPMDLSPGLTANIENTASDCFRLFLLRDYGRIDIRMDKAGRIHVLEINANCCLSPDAGFAAAAEHSGSSYSEMVIELLDSVMKRVFKHDHQACTISG